MHIVEPDGRLLSDLADDFASPFQTWGGATHDIEVALDEPTPTITFGGNQVPATDSGLALLSNFFQVPPKFLERVEPDERQFIMEHRIARSEERDLTINYRDGGLLDVLKAGQRRVPAEAIVETAMKVMPEDSLVVAAWSEPDDFRMDVIVPDYLTDFIGGDKHATVENYLNSGKPKVGDLTKGGLRFGQDRKKNLAPWVQTLLWRLACTNGMEIPNSGLKVDARGDSVEEILQMLEASARIGYDMIGAEIESFYAMRSEGIDKDVTGVLRRVAQDAGLADRTVSSLEDHLASIAPAGDEPSMFDLINTITNLANHESLENRRAPRRQLQMAGGSIIGSHTERCNLCHRSLS
jgi:hypothetical protein